MKSVTRILIQLGILRDDIDYHVVRASMVIIFLFFGYQPTIGLPPRKSLSEGLPRPEGQHLQNVAVWTAEDRIGSNYAKSC